MWPPFIFIGKRCRCPVTTAKRFRKTNFIPIRRATINTSSITMSFRSEKPAPPSGLRATENRAFEANIKQNHPDFSFYTSEHNDGHEGSFCHNGRIQSR